MSTNQIKPFATAVGANVLSADEYAALDITEGFPSGLLPSVKLNSVLRQSSFFAAMIAQFIADTIGVDILDDGNLAGLESKFISAIESLFPSLSSYATEAWVNSRGFLTSAPVTSVAGKTGVVILGVGDVSGAAPLANPALTGSPTAPTQAAADNSTKLATTAFANNLLLSHLGSSGFGVPNYIQTAGVLDVTEGSTITFLNSFSVQPTIIVGLQVGSVPSGAMTLGLQSQSTSGFTLKFHDNNGNPLTGNIYYIAIGV